MKFNRKVGVAQKKTFCARRPKVVSLSSNTVASTVERLEHRLFFSAYTFDDEFNGTVGTGPSSAWGKGNATDPNNGSVVYTNNTVATAKNPATLDIVSDPLANDGKALAMSLTPDPSGSGKYFSSEITTEFDPSGAGNNLEYGHVEARIKIPGGSNSGAIWPAFWLLGDNINTISWPNCGEIDVMENDGARPGSISSTLHGPASGGGDYNGGGGVGASYSLPGGANYYSAYHVFAADWGPSSVTFSVDGKAFYTLTPANIPSGATWPFNGHPFYFILDVCEGGAFAPGTITTTQTMDVDYVHANAYSAVATPPLTDQNVGSPTIAGSASFDGLTYTLNGSGTDVWGTSDQFNLDSQSMTGNATLITQVSWVGDSGQYAKGGLMIRDGTAANASYAFLQLNPANAGSVGTGGANFEFRNGTGVSSVSAGSDTTANLQNGAIWLKLVRSGNTFSGFDSTDGVTWTQVGASETISMSATVQAGLADSSNNTTAVSTDTFSNLSILPGAFSDKNLGTPDRAGSSGYNTSSATYTVSGGGTGFASTSDQFNDVSQAATGDVALIVDLASQSSTNATAMAGAMLRSTSAVNSPFASVVLTPSSGVEFLWRSTAGAAPSSVAVASKFAPIWLEIARYGNNISAYYSSNGTVWTQIGTSQSVSLGTTIQAGVAVTSGDSVTTNTASFSSIQALTPTSVSVTPLSSSIGDGQMLQLSASVLDQNGNAILPQPAGVVWSIDSGGAGSINSSTGLYTAPASGYGVATARATYGSFSSTSQITTVLSVINGTAGNDAIRLVRSGTSLNVYVNSNSPTYTVPYASLGAMTINGLGGTDTITLDFSGGASPVPAAGVTVNGGTLNVIGSTGNDTVTVNSSQVIVNGSAITCSNLAAIQVIGNGGSDTVTQTAQPAATLSFDGGTNATLNISAGSYTIPANSTSGITAYSLGSLIIGQSASVVMADAALHFNRTVLVLGNLTLAGQPGAWTANLNLNSNDLVVHNGNIAQLNDQLHQSAISSTDAATSSGHLTTLGIELNNDGSGNPLFALGTPLGQFDGQTGSGTDVLIKYSYYGDANLDGKVDGSDYSLIDNGYLNQSSLWSNGDFNSDGTVNGSDYTLIDNAFNSQGADLAAEISSKSVSRGSSASVAIPQSQVANAESDWFSFDRKKLKRLLAD